MVVAGDFNASSGNEPFRSLLRTAGLVDVEERLGRGLVVTWPTNRRWVPAHLHLDHVLVSREVVPVSVRLGRGEGSDHRPVLTELAVTG